MLRRVHNLYVTAMSLSSLRPRLDVFSSVAILYLSPFGNTHILHVHRHPAQRQCSADVRMPSSQIRNGMDLFVRRHTVPSFGESSSWHPLCLAFLHAHLPGSYRNKLIICRSCARCVDTGLGAARMTTSTLISMMLQSISRSSWGHG